MNIPLVLRKAKSRGTHCWRTTLEHPSRIHRGPTMSGGLEHASWQYSIVVGSGHFHLLPFDLVAPLPRASVLSVDLVSR